jgi:Domain of unknown function (DUF1995)
MSSSSFSSSYYYYNYHRDSATLIWMIVIGMIVTSSSFTTIAPIHHPQSLANDYYVYPRPLPAQIQQECFRIVNYPHSLKQHQQQQQKFVGVRRRHQYHHLMMNQESTSSASTTTTTTSSTTILPRDVKESIQICRESIQLALKDRSSRMYIDFPWGTSFQMETKKKKKVQDMTMDDIHTSHRELTRLLVEMFQPIGSNHIAVIFPIISMADIAKTKWSASSSGEHICQIMSMDRRRSNEKQKTTTKKQKSSSNSKKGFASKLAFALDESSSHENEANGITSNLFELPSHIEVAIFVAPSSKEIPIIERISKTVGMGTLIIIVNMNPYYSSTNKQQGIHYGSMSTKEYFMKEYQSIFYLAPYAFSSDDSNDETSTSTTSNTMNNAFIYHTYKQRNEWILSLPPSKTNFNIIRPPQTILVTKQYPSIEECHDAYQQYLMNNNNNSNNNNNNNPIMETFQQWFR